MFVVTADQRRSRSGADAVETALACLNQQSGGDGLVRPFERTAGDELQGVLDDAALVLRCVRQLTCHLPFRVGIGIGEVALPLPEQSRAGRGDAFVYAREAVTRARNTPQPVAVTTASAAAEAGADAQALFGLLILVESRRTAGGHEVVALVEGGRSVTDVAQHLGITKQAVSQRLRAAGWHETWAANGTVIRLLTTTDRSVSTPAERVGQ